MELMYEGRPTTAYVFVVPLNVVALRGSVPQQWDKEFNQTMAGKGKVSLSTAAAPGDIYAELLKTVPPVVPGAGLSPAEFIAGKRGPPFSTRADLEFEDPNTVALATAAASEAKAKKSKASKKQDGKYARADVVTLGDEFLAPAIAAGLILPLDDTASKSDWYRRLPPVWRQLVSRDPRSGLPVPARGATTSSVSSTEVTPAPARAPVAVYGTPYRFGCTLIAYRVDKLPASMKDRPPCDWADLWRPEFKGKVAIGGGARTMLTAALRAEGRSANAEDMRQAGVGGGGGGRDAVRNRLTDLRRQQLLVQDDAQYIQALSCGDAWIAAGPSDDILSLARRSSLIAVAVPASGTTLFADVWCVPATAARKPEGVSPLVQQWLDFTTQPARANLRIGLRGGLPPSVFDGHRIDYASVRMDGPTGGFVQYPGRGADDTSDYGPGYGTAAGVGARGDTRESTTEPGGDGQGDLTSLLSGGGSSDGLSGGDLMKGGMPSDAVWERSEFLSPLSPQMRSQYNDLIREWTV
jgi:spermidine/putrescine-binding protein